MLRNMEYLQWAPLLLAAEEYKAGRYGTVPKLAEPPKPAKRPAPTGTSGRLRMLRGLLGKAVRLTKPMETKGGSKYERGSLWRVMFLERGQFLIAQIGKGGKLGDRVSCVSHHSFMVDPEVSPDSEYAYKPTKRKTLPVIDDEDGNR